jgi:hypothetical protein
MGVRRDIVLGCCIGSCAFRRLLSNRSRLVNFVATATVWTKFELPQIAPKKLCSSPAAPDKVTDSSRSSK